MSVAQVSEQEGVLVLRPTDEGLRLCRVEGRVEAWLRDNPERPKVVVSLAGLAIVSSAGLASLVVLRRALAKSGGSMSLAEACDEIVRLLRFTKLEAFFGLDPTVEQAVARLIANGDGA